MARYHLVVPVEVSVWKEGERREEMGLQTSGSWYVKHRIEKRCAHLQGYTDTAIQQETPSSGGVGQPAKHSRGRGGRGERDRESIGG